MFVPAGTSASTKLPLASVCVARRASSDAAAPQELQLAPEVNGGNGAVGWFGMYTLAL